MWWTLLIARVGLAQPEGGLARQTLHDPSMAPAHPDRRIRLVPDHL